MKARYEFMHNEEYEEYLRTYAAVMAMQGYCGGEYIGQSGMPQDSIAEWCVVMAEAIIKALNNKP